AHARVPSCLAKERVCPAKEGSGRAGICGGRQGRRYLVAGGGCSGAGRPLGVRVRVTGGYAGRLRVATWPPRAWLVVASMAPGVAGEPLRHGIGKSATEAGPGRG